MSLITHRLYWKYITHCFAQMYPQNSSVLIRDNNTFSLYIYPPTAYIRKTKPCRSTLCNMLMKWNQTVVSNHTRSLYKAALKQCSIPTIATCTLPAQLILQKTSSWNPHQPSVIMRVLAVLVVLGLLAASCADGEYWNDTDLNLCLSKRMLYDNCYGQNDFELSMCFKC